jgi:hypothetical protein
MFRAWNRAARLSAVANRSGFSPFLSLRTLVHLSSLSSTLDASRRLPAAAAVGPGSDAGAGFAKPPTVIEAATSANASPRGAAGLLTGLRLLSFRSSMPGRGF